MARDQFFFFLKMTKPNVLFKLYIYGDYFSHANILWLKHYVLTSNLHKLKS